MHITTDRIHLASEERALLERPSKSGVRYPVTNSSCPLVVHRRAADPEQFALLRYRQRRFFVDHRLTLRPAQRLNLLDKKSRSMVNSPILSWSFLTSASKSRLLSALFSNTSLTCSKSFRFQTEICLMWTPCCCDGNGGPAGL